MWLFRKNKYCGKRFGTYTIEASIGEGKYGKCFLAEADDGKKVIIKKFKTRMLKKNLDKNKYEAVILSQLQDKRIPELLGVINEKGFYGFVLEFKHGYTVRDIIFKQKHKFSKNEFFDIGIKLIGIIKYLHENGVVHRDIRIPNVLINQEEVYLIDFGLARWANNENYAYNCDFSYLGDFLLYLLYSSFDPKQRHKKLAWYEELTLTDKQKLFLKRLFGLETIYENIKDIEKDFMECFKAL